MNWDTFNDALNKVNYDTAERQKAMMQEPLITKEEARKHFGISDAVESPNYDPMRMGLVIDGVFISDESLYRGEVLKGEIVDEIHTTDISKSH